jgi:hypothetical protein
MSQSETIDEVLQELGRFVNEEVAATQIAIGCLRTVAHGVLQDFTASEDKEETRLLGTRVQDGGWIPTVHGLQGAHALVEEMAEGGATHQRLTQQLIVTVYTGWEAEYRHRVAAARAMDVEAVRHDFFGDLRHLRNDIVHHRGIATEGHSTRCRTILNRQLRPGEQIYLRDDELRHLLLRVPWAALVHAPEQQDPKEGPSPE